jgi:DNA-binding IclR family transcriptional regulator
MSREISQTLDRGLRVLECVAEHPAGVTVGALAEELAVGRTVVYRLVATLEAHALVRRDDQGRVRLGLAALTLSAAAQPLLKQRALPILRELADSVGATAHLTRAEGEQAVAVAVVEPRWTDFHVGYREGARHPLDRGASGRAISSARGGAVTLIRSSGELQAGAHGVAVAIDSPPGLEASVGVVSLAPLVDSVDEEVLRAAAALSRALRN